MTEYVRAVFITAAVLALLKLLFYKDGTDGVRKFAFAVLALYVATAPLSEALSGIGDAPFFDFDIPDSEYGEDYEEVAEDAFCQGVKRLVCDKFSLSDECVRVLVENFDFNTMTAGRVRIFLSGRAAAADYKAIEKFISESGLGECDAEIEIG